MNCTCGAPLVCQACGRKYEWSPTLSDCEIEILNDIYLSLRQRVKGRETLKASEVTDAVLSFSDGKFQRFRTALVVRGLIQKVEGGPRSGPGVRYTVRPHLQK